MRANKLQKSNLLIMVRKNDPHDIYVIQGHMFSMLYEECAILSSDSANSPSAQELSDNSQQLSEWPYYGSMEPAFSPV